jgi:hypothetical protein
MTCILGLLIVGAPSSAATLFDRGEAAHAKAVSAAFEVLIEQRSQKQKTLITANLDYVRPNRVKLEMRQPASGALAAVVLRHAMDTQKYTGFNATSNEVIRKTVTGGDLGQRLASATGGVDQSMLILLSPATMKAMFAPFRLLEGWTVRSTATLTELTFQTDRTGSRRVSQFIFDRKLGFLQQARFVVGGDELVWRYRYLGPARNTSLAVPTSARSVLAFSVRRQPPKFLDAGAKKVLEASIAAYERPRELIVMVDERGETRRFWIGKSGVRERQGNVEWAYTGRRLMVRDERNKKFYAGTANLSAAFSAIQFVGGRIDPTLRLMMLGRNPVREILEPNHVVKSVGSITMDNAPASVLSISGPGMRIGLVVRQSDGLVASMTTENVDASGKTLHRSERRFRYQSVGVPLQASLFRLVPPKGMSTTSVSEIIR